jgi:enoyl-CoA hydratase
MKMPREGDSSHSSRRGFLKSSVGIAASMALPHAIAGEPVHHSIAEQNTEQNAAHAQGLQIEKKSQVATIRIPNTHRLAGSKPNNLHWELGEMFSDLRGDNSIRVVVITGAEDGVFGMPPDWHPPTGPRRGVDDPPIGYKTFTGIVRYHEAMVALEKPIVAKVNGHAIGTGQSIMFASDIIVAREDAIIADHHMGPVPIPGGKPVGTPNESVPGDGGVAWAPLYMSPAKAKEYLMLAKPYTAKEFEQMGIINYAVPAADLDSKVNDLVELLLQRSAYALAWTKRLVNRQAETQLNRSLDAAAAYSWINQLQLEKTGFKDPLTLE